MKKLQKEFEKFNSDIKIDTEAEMLRKKRDTLKADVENNFPDECETIGIDISKSDLRFINQNRIYSFYDNHVEVSPFPKNERCPCCGIQEQIC